MILCANNTWVHGCNRYFKWWTMLNSQVESSSAVQLDTYFRLTLKLKWGSWLPLSENPQDWLFLHAGNRDQYTCMPIRTFPAYTSVFHIQAWENFAFSESGKIYSPHIPSDFSTDQNVFVSEIVVLLNNLFMNHSEKGCWITWNLEGIIAP